MKCTVLLAGDAQKTISGSMMMSTIKEKIDYESESEESSAASGDNDNLSDDESGHSQEDKDETEESQQVLDDDKKESNTQRAEANKQYPVTFVCNALSDYTSKEAGELSFEKGDMLTIISIRKDGWWEAKNSDGIQGLVPSTFLKVPDQMNTLVNELLQSNDTKNNHFWSHLRSSLRKAHALNTAIQTFGAIGHPIGFRESLLGTLLKEGKNYRAETFLFPKLSDSGLSFEDMVWESVQTSEGKMSMQLKPFSTVLEKVIQIVALRQIIPPPSGFVVTSRHVHMCLHDGNKVLSNIHTTRASWEPKNKKIWMFSAKVPVDGSCLDEGQIFIRSNKSFATLGILFELCVSYRKGDSPDTSEMSCGWAFMRLLNDSGRPVKSKTKVLKVHNSVPFTNYLDTSAASLNSLQKIMNRNKPPRMVMSISNPKRSSTQQICYLPSTLIGPVSSIPLVGLYRKIISEDLLQRTSFDSNDLIQSPFLYNFPRMFNEPDLIDFFRCAWAERMKSEKNQGMRSESKKFNAFRSLFMETIFLIMNSSNLPPYYLGNITYEQERKSELAKIVTEISGKDRGILAFSKEMEFKPISVEYLSTYIQQKAL